jgi:hypothetical protein
MNFSSKYFGSKQPCACGFSTATMCLWFRVRPARRCVLPGSARWKAGELKVHKPEIKSGGYGFGRGICSVSATASVTPRSGPSASTTPGAGYEANAPR